MKVAIVGSRNIQDYQLVETVVLSILKTNRINLDEVDIVSGGARGVDSLAQQFAKHYGLSITIHYPNWNRYGKQAALIRNSKIVDDSDLVIAFINSSSKGTWDTINKALKKGIPTYIYNVETGSLDSNKTNDKELDIF